MIKDLMCGAPKVAGSKAGKSLLGELEGDGISPRVRSTNENERQLELDKGLR